MKYYVYTHIVGKEKFVFSAKSHAFYQAQLGKKLTKIYKIEEYATKAEAEKAAGY